MTAEKQPITTNAELSEALTELLRRADKNGINVRGAFECRNGVEHPDWDVVVTEIVKHKSSE